MRTTSTAELGIRLAGPDDRAIVARTLAAAFFDDPVTEWLIPDVARRQEVIHRVFELYATAYIRHDETYTAAGGDGVALWLPPNRELLTPEQGEAFGADIEALLGEDARRAGILEETFAEHHPTEPAYYLQLVATVPDAQGRGIGSALMREVLRQADWERMPAYLEATTLRSRALYERHGYVPRGEFTLPEDGPTLWPMWREPR
jgi:GNAT superfamily N-acetyltransferase